MCLEGLLAHSRVSGHPDGCRTGTSSKTPPGRLTREERGRPLTREAFGTTQGGAVTFGSSEEFFQAVRDLAAELESQGSHSAACELATGLSCLNGLTDGWASLLESLERVQSEHSSALTPPQADALAALVLAAHRAVYRV
jgi:hypothetical protein